MMASKPVSRATVTALARAAAAFAYEVARAIKDEDGENAKALAMVLADDPAAEFIASVRLSPDKYVVLSVVVGGRQVIVYQGAIVEVEGVQH